MAINDELRTERIHIDDIGLDWENPRNELSTNDDDAISKMLEDHVKLFNLAQDIAEVGQNPTELVSVIWDEERKKYIVLDGNRRVTALKIMWDPELIRNNDSLKRKIMTLDRTSIPEDLLAYVFESRADARRWINLKHTGENNGIGTVEWKSYQKSRFDSGLYTPSAIFLQYAISHEISTPYNHEAIKKRITNLERLVSDPDVRDFLGITKKGNEMQFPKCDGVVREVYTKVVEDFANPEFKVGDILNKPDRRQYIESLSDTFKTNGLGNKSLEPKPRKKLESDSRNDKERVRSRNRPTTRNRSKLIPNHFNIIIENDKVLSLFQELKKIDVNLYPNIVGMAFRCFLEMTCDLYLAIFNSSDVTERSDLKLKLDFMFTDLKSNTSKKLTDRDSNRILFETKVIPGLVDRLHGYIHSTAIQPNSQTLKTTWDNLESILELAYDKINQQKASGQ